jgi:PKD repeat protein
MLYYLSFTTGQIRRIRFNGPVAAASANPTSGLSPLTVSFSSAGSTDPGGGALTYLWEFGDGATSTLANPIYTYVTAGVATFTPRLTVRNPAGLTSSTTVKVTVGSRPPVPTIAAPASGTTTRPGDTVAYQGSASDPEDGSLPGSALAWTVLLHHNSHVHTAVTGSGAQGSFVATDHGTIGTFSYEIILTATDSSGLKTSTSVLVSVAPESVPPTDPSGLMATAVGSGQIDLAWSASSDNVGVTGYRVERCQGSGCANFVQVGAPAGTVFSDVGLAAATTYSYRVRATDASGNLSGYSNVAIQTTQSAPLPSAGLVLAYGFNAGAGTTVSDVSGNGNTGTISGASWSTQGRFGGALSFNGSNAMVVVPASASLNVSSGMTLQAWIFPTAAQSGWRTIMQREVDTYFLNASNDAGPLLPSGGGTIGGQVEILRGSPASPVNAWTHVALTYDGTMVRLYVNGVLASSSAASGAIQTNSNALRIGGNVPYGEFFQGLIDEVRVYTRALSQAEIQADMAAAVEP